MEFPQYRGNQRKRLFLRPGRLPQHQWHVRRRWLLRRLVEFYRGRHKLCLGPVHGLLQWRCEQKRQRWELRVYCPLLTGFLRLLETLVGVQSRFPIKTLWFVIIWDNFVVWKERLFFMEIILWIFIKALMIKWKWRSSKFSNWLSRWREYRWSFLPQYPDPKGFLKSESNINQIFSKFSAVLTKADWLFYWMGFRKKRRKHPKKKLTGQCDSGMNIFNLKTKNHDWIQGN